MTGVQTCALPISGVDVLCNDISEPLGRKNGLISEINTTPGLHHHYLIARPETGVRVAEALLEHMFKTGKGTLNMQKRRIAADPGNIVSMPRSKAGGN